MWERVAGQERAVERLRRAAQRPVHAYLLAGPSDAGLEDAARCFSAALVAPDGEERAVDRVLRGTHPDSVEFVPTTAMYTLADYVREPRSGEKYRRDRRLPRIIPEAHRAPTEGVRKVLIVFEAERLRGNQYEPQNALLKLLEEPPPRTVVILVSAYPDELLPTVRSRTQRIDFSSSGDDKPGAATDRLRPVREAFVEAALALDGTGGAVAEQADRVGGALGHSVTEFETAQQQEREKEAAMLEELGYPERTVAAELKRLDDRHAQEHRRARTDALVEGITALETVYCDVLAGPDAPRRNADRPLPALNPRSCDRALRACRDARDVLGEFNPNEGLLIERLLLQLPAAAPRPSR